MKIVKAFTNTITAFVLGLALLSTPLMAQTIEQKVTSALTSAPTNQEKIYAVHDLLQTASNTRESLKAEGAKAQARLADINQQNANFTATVERHNVIAADHDRRLAIHDNQTTSHNANRCTYYDGHEQDCAAYNNEETRLNNEGAGLDRERDEINREKQTLEAAGQGLQLEIDDFNKYK